MIGKWTTGEIDTLRAMLADGKPYRIIGQVLDRTEGSVEAKARGLGINPMPKRQRKDKATLCWRCENATNSGCLWSRHLRPVAGWTARYSPLKISGGRIVDSFTVVDCPEFVEG